MGSNGPEIQEKNSDIGNRPRLLTGLVKTIALFISALIRAYN
jgi:hypothetical protein